ncbi:MAG: restriction endonuclease [Chitinophagaceae bacterium]|nr:restriction endonuclease [Chitinophagaceae bacterium]
MIPDYQSLMLPLLKMANENQELTFNLVIDNLSKQFNLSEEDLNKLLPSGKQRVFINRIHWAKSHFKMAGLLEDTKRGHFKITERGKNILNQNPSLINIKFLRQFPEYLKFQLGKKGDGTEKILDIKQKDVPEQLTENSIPQTPEEQIEEGYQEIYQSLNQEILRKLKSVHPSFFERIVIELLVKMGYGGSIAEAGQATRYTNDEGIDGIIKEDKLGLDVIYIQAKRWEGNVARPEIQKFVGALAGQRAKKGVFITTSSFSKEAITYAAQMDAKIVLIDGDNLAQYMIDYNLGVSIQNIYEIKKMDSDYFEEE